MAVATWEQVATALARPTSSFSGPQQDQITWWLDGVELLIRKRLGPVSALDEESVIFVEVSAVAELVPPQGTTGESSITVTADDGSVTRRWEPRAVKDSDISADWWDLLNPTGAMSDAFTINPLGVRRRTLDAERCW